MKLRQDAKAPNGGGAVERVRVSCIVNPADALWITKQIGGCVAVSVDGRDAMVKPVSIVIAALTLATPEERARIKEEVAKL